MLNIMLDIEALGTRPNSIMLALAAVKFEFGSENTEEFSMNIDPRSCKELGMVTDPDTIRWWKDQPKEAREAFTANPVHVREVMIQFIKWIGPDWRKTVFWSNGSAYDFPIIEWALRELNIEFPWKYWNVRDARTLYGLCDINMKEYPRVGVHHNAIDDCKTQIKALKECLA